MTDPLRARYEGYIANFDPSPQNYGDDYSTPPDFETWVIEQEESDDGYPKDLGDFLIT